jgi:ketosteroid isomerase-like protein
LAVLSRTVLFWTARPRTGHHFGCARESPSARSIHLHEKRRQAMTAAQQKERVVRFLENFNHPDPRVFEDLITDDFRFEMITTMNEFAPVRGKTAFARSETERLNGLFPGGLKMKLITIVSEGPHVAVQAACDTVAMNGRRYIQRYHFYLRFEGELIAEGLEYNDTNLVREIFLT